MTTYHVRFVFGFIILMASAECAEILIQAEDMERTVSEVIYRRHASGNEAVHLYTGDSLQTELCFKQDTTFYLTEIGYSNDGQTDRVRVSFDNIFLDEFKTIMFTNYGAGWERFRSHQSRASAVAKSRHILKLAIIESDKYGVEIDFIKLSVNHSQGMNSVNCKSFCFEDITFTSPWSKVSPVGSARAVQRSVQTKCAEEDNINIPVFHENASKLDFVVTASLPKYRSFKNNRGPDWTNCQMYDSFWHFKDLNFSRNHIQNMGTSSLRITHISPAVFTTRQIAVIEVDFEFEGPSSGSTDSEVGSHVDLQNIQHKGILEFQFQYYDRYDKWSEKQVKVIRNSERNVKFITPDSSFREGKGNKIRIEVFIDSSSSNILSIGDILMYKRTLRKEESAQLYKDGATIIEGVDKDMWWRINETMSVTIKGTKSTFKDVDYIRIYRRVPWAQRSFSQVFVLYQDANIRLIPITPHGLDWIPFGSSVIVGQTNPLSNRPCAPIQHLDIDPNLLKLTVFYTDNNVISLTIHTTVSETQLHVSASHFVRDTNLYPFFTFRSMYVADDNNDVDHITSDVSKPKNIMEQWNELRGNFFAFFRQCISKHNTQSPDISIQILSSS